jgi:hypothetical protein
VKSKGYHESKACASVNETFIGQKDLWFTLKLNGLHRKNGIAGEIFTFLENVRERIAPKPQTIEISE